MNVGTVDILRLFWSLHW